MGKILLPNHLAKVDTLPMGVDFQKFQAAARRQVRGTDDIAWETLKDLKVVLSVDRLDYTKGILNRLQRLRAVPRAQSPQAEEGGFGAGGRALADRRRAIPGNQAAGR